MVDPYLDDHVHMVSHPAEGVNPASISLDAGGQQPHPAATIQIGEKDRLSAIAPEHYVINTNG
jgi:hypothetical protein